MNEYHCIIYDDKGQRQEDVIIVHADTSWEARKAVAITRGIQAHSVAAIRIWEN